MNQLEIREKKKELRKEIKARIKSLTEDYCIKADAIIQEKVINLPEFKDAKTAFCFVGTDGEPDTKPIILKAIEEGKRVGVPKCLTDSQMDVYEISSLDDLEEGMYGILEPKKGLPLIKPEEIDFSLIPCVSCDLEGNRLGHGKGYYDRYLTKGSFYTCMVCRGKLLSKDIPMDKYDIKPNRVISDYDSIEE